MNCNAQYVIYVIICVDYKIQYMGHVTRRLHGKQIVQCSKTFNRFKWCERWQLNTNYWMCNFEWDASYDYGCYFHYSPVVFRDAFMKKVEVPFKYRLYSIYLIKRYKNTHIEASKIRHIRVVLHGWVTVHTGLGSVPLCVLLEPSTDSLVWSDLKSWLEHTWTTEASVWHQQKLRQCVWACTLTRTRTGELIFEE